MAAANKVLITGASGFIGANLCRYFLAKGWEVDAIVKDDSDRQDHWRLADIENDNFNLRNYYLSNPEDVEAMFADCNPEIIVNCAAYGAYSHQQLEHRIYETNQNIVHYMLECAREVRNFTAFVQLGTSSEYGLNSKGSDERDVTIPNSHYAISKVAATSLCQYYGRVKELPTCVLRLGSVYGPFEDPNRFVMKACLEATEGRTIDLAGTEISRDFIYIDDVCSAVLQAIKRAQPGAIYNISNSLPTTLGTMYDRILKEFDMAKRQVQENPILIKQWDHLRPWYMSCAKARLDLKWEPLVVASEGIHCLKLWIQSNPSVVEDMKDIS